VVGVAIGIDVLHWVYFGVVPSLVARSLAGDRGEKKRHVLEFIVATPSLLGPSIKAFPRFQLVSLYQVAHEHEKAVALARRVLHGAIPVAGLEALIRQHLSDSLEALGRTEEAEAERSLAMQGGVEGQAETFLAKLAEGGVLERANRDAEACAVFERTLELASGQPSSVRARIMAHLSIASFNAGRLADTIRWAEEVFALAPDSSQARILRRMAAVAHGNQGRLDEAERQIHLALEAATEPKAQAELLAIGASYAMRSGALAEAERMAREAESLVPGRLRMPWVILAELAALRGEFAQAIDHLERAQHIEVGHVPALERRAQAAVEKEIGLYLADLGRLDEALARLETAEAELGQNPKLAPGIHAALGWVHALAGGVDQAIAHLDLADNTLEDTGEDRTSRKSALKLLGRAALALDDPQRAENDFRAYMDLVVDPVYRPSVLYFLAECRRRQGDLPGARNLNREAAATDYGVLYERLARERLRSTGAGLGLG
jgi:tetratricopeptide (TPR) repeat protein